jgi:uncharacterized membrane protein
MTWIQRYRVRRYFRESLWIPPVLAMLAALGAVRLLHGVERLQGWEADIHPDTARAVLGTLASSMFTFIVFVSSALLVVVQLASVQLTPRIIGVVFRDVVTRFALTVFVFTFTFSLAALVRIGDSVPLVTAHVASYACLASLGVFLFLIDHVGRALRPSGALRSVARMARRVIEDVYPHPLGPAPDQVAHPAETVVGELTATIPSPSEGVILAFDVRGLATLAGRYDCVLELVPEVGDFVAVGVPLFRVYGGKTPPPAQVLFQSVAVGQERTLEQDPSFAFRIMVDIASKGLSPAINDPTTAVLALDQIHSLLRAVGGRKLDDGYIRDARGCLRLLYRTPNWSNFVLLAVTEIRHFGGQSIQIARRLRAMMEDLIRTLPESRAALLRRELALLRRSTERFFDEPEDRALADVGDLQGVGGKEDSTSSGEGTARGNGP